MSTTISGSGGTNYNRVSGLATGIDTESMVEALTTSTRLRIQKLEQQKQSLLWKQEAFRTITKSVMDFKSKYFTAWSSSSVNNAGFFKQMSVTSTQPAYLTATANASAAAGEITVQDIKSLASAQKVTSSAAVSRPLEITVDPLTVAGLAGKSMRVSLDGQAREITFSAPGGYSGAGEVAADLQTRIDEAFGDGRILVSIEGNVLRLTAPGSEASIGQVGRSGEEAAEVLSFTDGQSNRIATGQALSSLDLAQPLNDPVKFKINGISFEFSRDKTLAQVMEGVNSSAAGVQMTYSTLTDKITLTAKTSGSGDNIRWENLDGSNFLTSLLGAGVETAGVNAELVVNGETVIRSSNSFTIDGVKFSLLGMAPAAGLENITLNTSLNVDQTVSNIKGFVDSYNQLIQDINAKLGEERDRNYLPLTDEQKEELSEDEVSKWTEKAKSGLLRNDPHLQKMLTALRGALFAEVKQVDSTSGLGISLAAIGIKTGLYTDKGKLEVDEAALRNALETKADAVVRLFTQKSGISDSSTLTAAERIQRTGESGLAWRLTDILDENVRTTRNTAGMKGSLLEIAGISGDISEFKNAINTQLLHVDRNIGTQNDRLDAQQDRLWKRFTAMESAISKMNQQSAWLTQQTGGNQ